MIMRWKDYNRREITVVVTQFAFEDIQMRRKILSGIVSQAEHIVKTQDEYHGSPDHSTETFHDRGIGWVDGAHQ